MIWKRAIVRTVSEFFALTSVFSSPRSGFRVIMYHAVGTPAKYDPQGIYSIDTKSFERHMTILANYHNLSIVNFHNGHASNGKLEVAVTFDDGYKDNLYTAAPILLKYNIPFTVFVTSSFIKSNSPDILNPKELRELASYPGVTIGAHSATHAPLIKCNDDELKKELQDSKYYIEDLIGGQVTTFSYPYGLVDTRVRDAAETAGYVRAGGSLFGINTADSDPLLLCRSEILSYDSERVFLQKLHGDWDWHRYLKGVKFIQ